MKNFLLLVLQILILLKNIFFSAKEEKIRTKLFKAKKKGIKYSIDSWKNYWYIHTNENALDYKVLRCAHNNIKKFRLYLFHQRKKLLLVVLIF